MKVREIVNKIANMSDIIDALEVIVDRNDTKNTDEVILNKAIAIIKDYREFINGLEVVTPFE